MPIQTAFNGGEFSDLMGGDVDLPKRAFSVSLAQNLLLLKQGPAVTRGPTVFVKEVKDSNDRTALVRFEFNDKQSYMIEVGDLYFRFYKDYEQIESAPNVPVEVVTPYAVADLFDDDNLLRLSFAQSADVLFIVHPDYEPQSLTRISDTSWTLTELVLDDGPYLDLNSTATTITPSAVSGAGITLTASAATFVSTDVGRAVRLRHGTSPTFTWGWALITAYTSSTLVTATVQSNFGATTATAFWRLGMYSETTGYPSAVTFFQDRIALNGPATNPDYYAMSKTSGYSSTTLAYQPTNAAGTVADDNSIVGRIPSGQVNGIRWMIADMRGLVLGTGKEEFVVRASSFGEAVTPSNANCSVFSAAGGAAIPPVRTMNGSTFVQDSRRKVFDIIYSFEQDSLKPQDLTLAAEHITRGRIIGSSYQKEPVNIIWFVRNDGVLIGMTHYPDQEVFGWHRHVIGGTDAIVESISSIPSPTGERDDLWLIVKRTINGVTKRYVEYMARYYEDDMEVYEGARGDSRFSYIGALTDTVTGLDHLEGETVKVMVDGKSHPDLVVTGGEVVLANDRTGSNIQIGLAMPWRLVTREPEIKLKSGDTVQGKYKRITDVKLRLLNTLGLSYGAYNQYLIPYSFGQGQDYNETPALFSGDTEGFAWPQGSSTNNQMEFGSDSIFPACIVAIMYDLKVQP